MPAQLLPTTLVGSYPQPDWLIDRDKLSHQTPPRVRAKELWRVAPDWLEQAQDDATILAIRDQERAGLDIVTDGEMRRESYSNRFATALDGIDLDNPGSTLSRSGMPIPVPRVVGKIRRRHPVEVRDVKFLRQNTDRTIKMTYRARSPWRSRRRTISTATRRRWRSTTRPPSMPRSRTCSRPAPTWCRSTSRGCRRDPRRRGRYGIKALNAALEGVTGTTAVHICFGYAQTVKTEAGRLRVPVRVRAVGRRAGVGRDRAAQARSAR